MRSRFALDFVLFDWKRTNERCGWKIVRLLVIVINCVMGFWVERRVCMRTDARECLHLTSHRYATIAGRMLNFSNGIQQENGDAKALKTDFKQWPSKQSSARTGKTKTKNERKKNKNDVNVRCDQTNWNRRRWNHHFCHTLNKNAKLFPRATMKNFRWSKMKIEKRKPKKDDR